LPEVTVTPEGVTFGEDNNVYYGGALPEVRVTSNSRKPIYGGTLPEVTVTPDNAYYGYPLPEVTVTPRKNPSLPGAVRAAVAGGVAPAAATLGMAGAMNPITGQQRLVPEKGFGGPISDIETLDTEFSLKKPNRQEIPQEWLDSIKGKSVKDLWNNIQQQ
jgi:hypothetical protein